MFVFLGVMDGNSQATVFLAPSNIDNPIPPWDHPTMKLIADAKGRLTSAELFKPGRVFDASPMADGSIRIVELVEKPVPVVKAKFNRDGTVTLPRRPSREAITAALRADRAAQ